MANTALPGGRPSPQSVCLTVSDQDDREPTPKRSKKSRLRYIYSVEVVIVALGKCLRTSLIEIFPINFQGYNNYAQINVPSPTGPEISMS
jgi:hypothetical protein